MKLDSNWIKIMKLKRYIGGWGILVKRTKLVGNKIRGDVMMMIGCVEL